MSGVQKWQNLLDRQYEEFEGKVAASKQEVACLKAHIAAKDAQIFQTMELVAAKDEQLRQLALATAYDLAVKEQLTEELNLCRFEVMQCRDQEAERAREQEKLRAELNLCRDEVMQCRNKEAEHMREREQLREELNLFRGKSPDVFLRPSQSREETNLHRDEARDGSRQHQQQPAHHLALPQREEQSRALDEQQRQTMMILDFAYSAMETLLHAAEDMVAACDVKRADRLRRLSALLEKHTLKWARKGETVENNDGSDNDDPQNEAKSPSRYEFAGDQEDLLCRRGTSTVTVEEVTVEEVHPSPPPNLVELEQGNRTLEAERELELELELFEDLVAAAREIASLTAENKALYAKMASMKTEMNLIQGQDTKGQDLNLRLLTARLAIS